MIRHKSSLARELGEKTMKSFRGPQHPVLVFLFLLVLAATTGAPSCNKQELVAVEHGAEVVAPKVVQAIKSKGVATAVTQGVRVALKLRIHASTLLRMVRGSRVSPSVYNNINAEAHNEVVRTALWQAADDALIAYAGRFQNADEFAAAAN